MGGYKEGVSSEYGRPAGRSTSRRHVVRAVGFVPKEGYQLPGYVLRTTAAVVVLVAYFVVFVLGFYPCRVLPQQQQQRLLFLSGRCCPTQSPSWWSEKTASKLQTYRLYLVPGVHSTSVPVCFLDVFLATDAANEIHTPRRKGDAAKRPTVRTSIQIRTVRIKY